jgi:uncharacterized BrkB/YihY/UPF0761 family membrane protein
VIGVARRQLAPAVAGVRLLGRAVAAWWNDDLLRLGASLAYYTLFAIAPILLIAVAVRSPRNSMGSSDRRAHPRSRG